MLTRKNRSSLITALTTDKKIKEIRDQSRNTL